MRRILNLFLGQRFFIKTLFIAAMAVITFFIDKSNHWYHWSWVSYALLAVALLAMEYFEHKENGLAPLEKIKKRLSDVNGWVRGGPDDQSYYSEAPEFTIRTCNEENHLDFTQEWTRGEIGSTYTAGNGAHYSDLYFYETCLKRVHIVIFDGGKKTIVAPDWEAIGAGRIYFYLEDSVDYSYQMYLSTIYEQDFSKGLRKLSAVGEFDIPIFKNKADLDRFISCCKEGVSDMPETNAETQNKLFYENVEKYKVFISSKRSVSGVMNAEQVSR